jgi:DNA replicative helicase MCM subunit Mcm2 (Cdc46/Mcm family)
MSYKEYIHVRVVRVTHCSEVTKFVMPKSTDIGRFVELSGTVIRTGSLKSLEWERTYECVSCKHTFKVKADIEQKNSFPKIYICPSRRQKPCSGNFRVVEGSSQKYVFIFNLLIISLVVIIKKLRFKNKLAA